MKEGLPDSVLTHLRQVVDRPDLSGTRYRLRGPLDRGGMGRLWIAEDIELLREVALKVLAAPDPSREEAARLLGEARLLAKLDHPAIVPVHDAGALADGRVFYTMKLVRGERLDAWLAHGPPRPARLRLVQRVAEAVAFAHQAGVVHRDLKPDNIMLGPFGEVYVMDWGVARAAGRDEEASGTVVGTPGWMAPEQARGEARVTGPPTDVWGLGALLLFVLVGESPGAGLGRLRDVPRPLASLCAAALEGDAARRIPSARALADDLERFLDGNPVSVHRETLAERAGRLARRHQAALLVVGSYLLLRLLIFVLAT
ncbi:MAG TPA: serine/threonine-protein kinase [Candidatus Polarisedimenticolaceae bacterium]|nr:serine/threonine-protein kinase [Candidatus Polarisedimenticolaceae bacterium]